jgi:AraC family transcriptional regulator of adaptative response/methylated-DNA-[protein]-cysteine methyltransferase
VGNMIKVTKINTPLGQMVAAATEDGICLLEFAEGRTLESDYENLTNIFSTRVKKGSNIHSRNLKKQLKEYFRGKRKEFSLPLVIRGTQFQEEVWTELMKIPFGATSTYLEQAEAVKKPNALRAVGHANASNRIAIIIPCHRVIGNDGTLVGYGGGLMRKKWLLEHEKKYSGIATELDLFAD